MPWYGFIHPILAVFTAVYGIIITRTSISKLPGRDFPIRRQRFRSAAFFLLCVANMTLGFVVRTVLRGQSQDVKLIFHVPLAIGAVAFALLAVLVTLSRTKRPGRIPDVVGLHPWLLVVSIVLIMTMGFIGISSALGI